MNKSQSKKAYWATQSPEKRSQVASDIAKARHAALTPEERSENAKRASKGRWKNKKLSTF